MPAARPSRLFELDRLAIGLSGLCVVHCLATTVLVAMMSVAGGLLLDPRIHEAGLALALLLGAFALGRGTLRHRRLAPAVIGGVGLAIMAAALVLPHDGHGAEAAGTIVGVSLLATAHALNRRADARLAGLRRAT